MNTVPLLILFLTLYNRLHSWDKIDLPNVSSNRNVWDDLSTDPMIALGTTINRSVNRFSKVLIQTGSQYEVVKKKNKPRYRTINHLQDTGLWYVTTLLIMHDLELNPGPPKKSSRCGNCNKPVLKRHDGVQCDSCDKWYHINPKCQNVAKHIYLGLDNSDVSWECLNCGMPNIKSGYFTLSKHSVSSPNPYDALSQPDPDSQLSDVDDPGPPLASSSPRTEPPSTQGKKQTPKRGVLKVLNVNCQSLSPKKAEFQTLIDNTQPDIIIATETWLKEGVHHDGELGETNRFSAEYKIYRKDRKDGYGGVLVAVSQNLISARVEELETKGETVWVRVNIAGSKSLYIAGCYRPHENDEEGHEELVSSMSKAADHRNNYIWMAGDFNYPGISWEGEFPSIKDNCRNTRLHEEFLEAIDDYNLEQMVQTPTRGENTLDLFLTNNTRVIDEVSVIPGLSDHEAVIVHGNITPVINTQKKRAIPLYKKAEWNKFEEHVSKCWEDLGETKANMNVNTLWINFKRIIETGVSKFIPHKNAKKKDSLPWLTKQIKRLMKKRDKLYSRFKQTKLEKDRKAFRRLKHEAQKQQRQAYWAYVQDLISPEQNNDEDRGNKKFWTYIKHCKQDSSGVAPLLDKDGKLVDDAKGKAEILNGQFTSAFSKISPLTLAQTSAQTLRKHFPSFGHQGSQNYRSPHTSMPDITISNNGVRNLLKNLKPHKAAGPDNIRPIILKTLCHVISPILTFMFQRSLRTGELPDEWRQANVVPIFKKGPRKLAENYRPVSLTCICSKLMEHVITSGLMKHLERNNILHGKQFGFRAKRSCETQLLELVEDIHRNMQSGTQTDLVVMDFSKAFDKVSHTRLLYKLQWYGIRGQTLAWIKGFLSNRSQRVVVEGEHSEVSPVTSGVPQGSVLGPALFLVYINDLPDCVASQVRLFADDTIIYRSINNDLDRQALQQDLDRLVDWEQDWLMEFHPKKCQVIRVTRARQPIETEYYLHGHQLETVDGAKYLGVTITQNMSWNTHISNTTSKANKILGLLKRNIKISSPQIKEKAYNSMVRPILEYGAVVWDPYTKTNINKVEMVQRRAARWTLNRYHNTSSVTDMLSHLEWPTLTKRREEARLIVMYKLVHVLVATNICLYTTPSQRSTRSTHPYSFIRIPSQTDAYRMSYFPRTVIDWNKLPLGVVTAPSLDAFKDRLVGLRPTPN